MVNRLILESIFPKKLKGAYLSTKDVCEYFLKKSSKNKVILVAHPEHIYRCRECLKECLKRPATFQRKALEILVADCRNVHYDKDSAQIWTRNKWINRYYEFLALLSLKIKLLG